MKRILIICTSNRDRSPALEQYFRANYPQHEYRSAGVNKYFCEKHGTHYLTQEDIDWSDMIVFAENIHKVLTINKHIIPHLNWISLNLGNYQQGCIGEDYLLKAEEKLKIYLK